MQRKENKMHDFVLALIGGAMIGFAAVMLMVTQGRVMGVSGMVSNLLPPYDSQNETSWRLAFILGVIAAPILSIFALGYSPKIEMTANTTLVVISGLIVGLGTVTGNGCTSGHGVCGLARLSERSLAATTIFMGVAIATVFIVNLTGAS